MPAGNHNKSENARAAARGLGELVTGTEARLAAHALINGESVSSAFAAVDPSRRATALAKVTESGLRQQHAALLAVLAAIEGARSQVADADVIWTMPGHLAGNGALTPSLVRMVDSARDSVVCSTYNFQKSSGMWAALRAAAHRPGVHVRLYMDSTAASTGRSPSAAEAAAQLAPAVVHSTSRFDGRAVRNHAKFLSIDHRWIVVTSANFSWSAEYANIELGIVIDDTALADRIEREMRDAEEILYERTHDDGAI